MKMQENHLPFLVSGKFGDLVGRVINGKQFFSKMPRPRKGKPSFYEMKARRNLAIGTRFLKQTASLLKKYDEPNGKTGYHKAMSYVLREAIQGEHPNQRIDYSRVILGKGDLPNPKTYHVESPAKGLLEFTWSYELARRGVSKSDRIFTVAYCESLHAFRFQPYGAERRERKFQMDVSLFSGRQIEIYFGFASYDGSIVSTSVYAGPINVL